MPVILVRIGALVWMNPMVSPVTVLKAMQESTVRTTPTSVPASLARMEAHVKMRSTATHVPVLLATRETNATKI